MLKNELEKLKGRFLISRKSPPYKAFRGRALVPEPPSRAGVIFLKEEIISNKYCTIVHWFTYLV